MRLLVKFEDKYGAFSIAAKLFGIDVSKVDDEPFICSNGTIVDIVRGMSNSGIFKYQNNMHFYDKIILVYDMDGFGGGPSYLSPERLRRIIKKQFGSRYESSIDKYLFVPTIFCCETLVLHKFDPNTIDFSQTYSKVNTANMHADIITDIINADINKINIKKVQTYIGDTQEIVDAFNQTIINGFSDLNMTYFNWVLSGDISDTSNLLSFSDALQLQATFRDRIRQALNKGKTGIVYKGKTYL